MAQSDALSLATSRITSQDKVALLAMKALIDAQLKKLDGEGDVKMESEDPVVPTEQENGNTKGNQKEETAVDVDEMVL